MTEKDLKTISLFSGAGGLDLGFEEAGFDIVAAVEKDEDCCKTLEHNFEDHTALNKDITKLDSEEVLRESGYEKDDIGVIIAGPPCQSFSGLGKRKGMEDERGSLFDDLIRFVDEIEPHTFVVENVKGILSVGDGDVPEKLASTFVDMGYNVNIEVLNSANYGVPQKRERVIFLCNKDKGLEFPAITHSESEWNTVGDALKGITDEDRERDDNFGMNHTQKIIDRMKHIDQGENFKQLPMDMRPNCWKNGSHEGADTFGRLDEDKPSVTIRTAGYNPTKGRYIHPWENRGLQTIEMAVLQSFPMDFEFKGSSMKTVGRQIGNAVPPLLAENIADAVKKQIEGEEIKTKHESNLDLDFAKQESLATFN